MKLEISLASAPVLYHIARLVYAHAALKNNQIRFSPVNGSKEEYKVFPKKDFYLSTARIRSSAFFRKHTLEYYVPFVGFIFDGNKVSHNLRTEPVDYFYMNGDPNTFDEAENEERIYSDKSLNKFHHWIKEIYVYCYGDLVNHYSQQLNEIYSMGKKLGVPVRMTTNLTKFNSFCPTVPLCKTIKHKGSPLVKDRIYYDEYAHAKVLYYMAITEGSAIPVFKKQPLTNLAKRLAKDFSRHNFDRHLFDRTNIIQNKYTDKLWAFLNRKGVHAYTGVEDFFTNKFSDPETFSEVPVSKIRRR